jgi:membrane protease YdiL (CAAX protease family)
VQTYLLSNVGEELIFRGYLLLVLIRRFGLSVGLFITSVLFGLFLLPGLTGLAALKMVFTTAACSYLFASAFLATGTIWAAIALHFVGNVALHKITGLSHGQALLKPVLQGSYPTSFDPAFWVSLSVPLLLAWALFRSRTLDLGGRLNLTG